MKKSIFALPPMAFGESGAKQSQDDKPQTHLEPVRTVSVEDGFWSRLSLHSRRGSGLTSTWPLLAGLCPVQSIPARPFGLGLRFDGALLVTRADQDQRPAARSIKPTRRGEAARSILRFDAQVGRSRNGQDNADWLGSRARGPEGMRPNTVMTNTAAGGV